MCVGGGGITAPCPHLPSQLEWRQGTRGRPWADPAGWRGRRSGGTAKLKLASLCLRSRCPPSALCQPAAPPPVPQTPTDEVERVSKTCPLDGQHGDGASGCSRGSQGQSCGRSELTVAVRVSLDRRVHLLNVLWRHPASIPQASLGQDLKHMVPHEVAPRWSPQSTATQCRCGAEGPGGGQG